MPTPYVDAVSHRLRRVGLRDFCRFPENTNVELARTSSILKRTLSIFEAKSGSWFAELRGTGHMRLGSALVQTQCLGGVLALAISLAFMASRAIAADISILDKSTTGTMIAIEGDLELGDGEKFATLIRAPGPGLVIFNSNGGNLLAGLRIGELARSRGFSTLVLDDRTCASACALAWLGGERRFLGPNARLGFHAAYASKDGTNQISGSANALVGAYLDRLNIPYEAIYELTDAGPESIRWLTVDEANRLGIPARLFQLNGGPTEHAAARAVTPRQRALEAMNAYFSAGSSDALTATSWLSAHYATSVVFYGRSTAVAEVLRNKRAFVKRWPERLYIPIVKSVVVDCSRDGRSCLIKGPVEYECRSHTRGAYSAGLASFSLTIDVSSSIPRVTGERSKVLVRR